AVGRGHRRCGRTVRGRRAHRAARRGGCRATRECLAAACAPRLLARRRRACADDVRTSLEGRATVARRAVRVELVALPPPRGREGAREPAHAARSVLPGPLLPRIARAQGAGLVRELPPCRRASAAARRRLAPPPGTPR